MLITVYQTSTGYRAVGLAFIMNPRRRTNLLSNVEIVMLLTLCTNFHVLRTLLCNLRP